MASFRVVRRALCTAAEATPTPAPAPAPAGRWERLKNSKAGVWCRSLLSDYKEACKEIVVGARDRPLKASVYMGLLGGAYACFTTKPDQQSFQAALLDRSNQLALLSPWIRNPGSDLHVQNLLKLRNQGHLRHLSLGLFSLVYSADYDPDSALYEARCSNLSVPWRELHERVLDVGFVGRWWVLEKKMEDFDVNEAEYKHLPAHMQGTTPPSVQEVERNEKLHRESWLPLPVQEEEETGERTGTQEGATQVKTGDTEDVKSVDTNVDIQTIDAVETNVDSQVIEAVDTNVDSPVIEAVETNVDSQVIDAVDTNVDIQIIDAVETNVDSQVIEAVDTNVDSQVIDTVETNVDSPVIEAVETNVDSQVIDAVETNVDSPVIEAVDTNVDSQVIDAVDTNVDSPVIEAVETNVDSQVIDAVETNVDCQVIDAVETNVDSQMLEAVDTKKQVKSSDPEEETLVVDTNVDSHDAETVDTQADTRAAEAVDIQEDKEVDEPAQHRAAKN